MRDDAFCSELEQILGLQPQIGDTLAKRQAQIIKAACQLSSSAGRLAAGMVAVELDKQIAQTELQHALGNS